MSSRSRRSPAAFAAAVALTIAGTFALAGATGAVLAAGAAPGKKSRDERAPAHPALAVVDDSTAAALGLLHEMRLIYGGDDSWAQIEGFRYDITYTIPGPGGAPVRTWTEAHHVWIHDVRARIDVLEDSTITIVDHDTTRVFRDGRWTTDSLVVAAARAQAHDLLWSWQLPRTLVDRRLRVRQLQHQVKGEPFSTRFFFERPGLPRPEGTVLTITFTPPTYAMRRLHWYDPRGKAWYLLELEGDQRRYNYTWAGRRTLHASDAAGESGPVLWTAAISDFQLETSMPTVVLAPPGAGAGVIATPAPAPASADTTARR